MAAGNSLDTEQDPRVLIATRIFDAPRELVFAAWTDLEHLKQWWGPNGFSTTTHSIDVRSGGVWRFVMHGPDGRDYQNRITYDEVVKPERLVYHHGGGDDVEPVQFRVTVTFEDLGGKTRLTMRALFPSAEERTRVVKQYGADEGMVQTLARLQQHVAAMASSVGAADQEMVVTRTFNAPRELVWKANTELERLKHWWGPKGFTWLGGKLDLRPGGMFHYGMRSPDGVEMWGRFVYREIVAPEKLVFVVSFSDANAGMTRHPWAPNWPLEVLNTSTFAERDRKTTITIRGIPINATDIERETFAAGRDSMRQGFAGTLDQLEAYLAKA